MLILGLSLLAFLITILVLVSVHEFGHFIVAKALGIKVLIFSLGFGPAIVRRRSKAGTEYRIACLPLGGYVKLLDEHEAPVPEHEKAGAFNNQSLWKRAAVVLAGPAINFIFAIVVLWCMWVIGVEQTKPIVGKVISGSIAQQAGLPEGAEILSINAHSTPNWQKLSLALIRQLGSKDQMQLSALNPLNKKIEHYTFQLKNWKVDRFQPDPVKSLGLVPYLPPMPPIINQIKSGSPAANAGLQIGDKLLAINDQAMSDWSEISEFLRDHPNQEIQLSLLRQGRQMTIPVSIGKKLWGLKSYGYLGIMVAPPQWEDKLKQSVRLQPLSALGQALQDTWDFTAFNFIVLGKMITGKISLLSLGGPIAIFETSGMAFVQGLTVYLGFLALISIMLGSLNLLPIPGLDGGHLLFFIIESIIRRPIPLAVQALILRIGVIFLLVLMFQATINDLIRTFG